MKKHPAASPAPAIPPRISPDQADSLPEPAHLRLRELTGKTPIFTSTEASNDVLMLHRAGYAPLAQVLGASVFQTGAQWTSGGWRDSERKHAAEKGISFELTAATSAFYRARALALERLEMEAKALRADLVVGIKITRRSLGADQPGAWEFNASGTAVRHLAAPKRQEDSAVPLCGLSGAQLYQLLQSGWQPVGMVIGNCYWMHYANANSSILMLQGAWTRRGRRNQEMTDLTGAVYRARAIAMERMQKEATALRARGVVEVMVESDFPGREEARPQANQPQMGHVAASLVCHFLAMGTAIVPAGPLPERADCLPLVAISLHSSSGNN